MRSTSIFGVGFIVLFVISLYFYFETAQNSMLLEEQTKYLSRILSFEERLFDANAWVGDNTKENNRLKEAGIIRDKISIIDADLYGSVSVLCIVVVLQLLLILGLYRYYPNFVSQKILGVCFLVLVLYILFLGINLPLFRTAFYIENLSIPIDINLPILGNMSLHRDINDKAYVMLSQKSILGFLSFLVQSKNYVLFVCILGFSILIPLLKIICTFFIILGVFTSDNMKKFVYYIGKWSMGEVFVVAITVYTLFSSDIGNAVFKSEYQLLAGFYFFVLYALLSIFSFSLIQNKKTI